MQSQEPLPHRRAIGGDVYLTIDPEQPDRPRVDSGFTLPGWRPRPPRVPSRPAFPGTAVLIDDRWYELVSMEMVGVGARRIYHLEPWDPDQPIRAPRELTPEACEQATKEHRAELKRQRGGCVAGLLIVFVGLLPGDEQKRLESEYGIRPTVGTLLSALILGAGSIATLLLIFALSQGMPLGPLKGFVEFAAKALPVFPYLVIESLFRIHGALNDQPLGTFLVAGPYTLARSLFGQITAGPQLPPASRAVVGSEEPWRQAEDRVTVLEPTDDGRHRLEIRSQLPKNHWRAHVHGIDWDGRRYVMDERIEEPKADLPYGFVLVEAGEDVLFRDLHAYDPKEVRELYRAQKRLSVGSWVKTFGLLWGFTDPKLQETLAETYGYQPWRNTRGSIVFSLFSALLTLGTAAYRIHQQTAVIGDAVLVIFFVVLTWDAVVRWVRLRQGELTESVVGPAIAPFVRPTLRWRADPGWRYADDA